MSEPQLSELLDRAVDQAPTIRVEGEEMLTEGKRRVRQRRTVAGSAMVGVVTLPSGVPADEAEPVLVTPDGAVRPVP